MNSNLNNKKIIQLARRVLEIEAEAVATVANRITEDFVKGVGLLLTCSGRAVCSGIGKSGHVARKIAATLASTGTPAFFVHPTEAGHGDLGMLTEIDVFIAISNSGETGELLAIAPFIKRRGIKLLSITQSKTSTLGKISDVCILVKVEKEACPHNLAPTASTTAVMALGDALAMAILNARGFGPEDFARSHPGGVLGRRLLTRVSDVMCAGDLVPKVSKTASVLEAVFEMTVKRLGMTAIVDQNDQILGIFTDGDLRRIFCSGGDFGCHPISEVMTLKPQTLFYFQLATEAVELMERMRINHILVTDENYCLVGALNMHDLFSAKVI